MVACVTVACAQAVKTGSAARGQEIMSAHVLQAWGGRRQAVEALLEQPAFAGPEQQDAVAAVQRFTRDPDDEVVAQRPDRVVAQRPPIWHDQRRERTNRSIAR